MEDNIFKRLRKQTTKTKTTNRRGKQQEIETYISQEELAEKMGIDQGSVSKAERGIAVTLGIIKAYHDYFGTPYDTLCGETDTEYLENININKEYGLTDKALETIKSLSPVALSMLNVFLSNSNLDNDSKAGCNNAEHFFYSLADIGYSMVNRLTEVSPDKDHLNKDDDVYRLLRQKMADLFMDYMHTLKMGDLINVLIQIEKREQQFKEYQYSEEHIKEMEEYQSSAELLKAKEEYMQENH